MLLAAVLFVVATLYLWLVKRRATERELGLQALAGMHWRDFSELVKRALREQRDLHTLPHAEDGSRQPASDFLLGSAEGPWLVWCKHGLAYRIGTAAINELGAAARLAGARGGLLITEGRVERASLATAEKQAVEVLDGPRLWPLLLPYLPGDIESRVRDAARREAVRRTVIAALACATIGLAAAVGFKRGVPASAVEAPAPTQPPALRQRPEVATASPAQPAPPMLEPDPDDSTLQAYQQAVSRALLRVPGVTSGIWQTRQTLVVSRTGTLEQVWPRICEQVIAYPALRTVRIQLNARPGVDEPVRWRQCATL
ncbi:hypothetical protein FHY09_001482 [Xanthomonas sp. 60]